MEMDLDVEDRRVGLEYNKIKHRLLCEMAVSPLLCPGQLRVFSQKQGDELEAFFFSSRETIHMSFFELLLHFPL